MQNAKVKHTLRRLLDTKVKINRSVDEIITRIIERILVKKIKRVDVKT